MLNKRYRFLGLVCSSFLGLVGLYAKSVASAAPFVNLNFESAFGGSDPGGFAGAVPTSTAFPGWTLALDDQIVTTVSFNSIQLAGPTFALNSQKGGDPTRIINGSFAAELVSAVDLSGSPPHNFVTASLSQMGDVPSSAQSIRFLSRTPSLPMTLTLDGQTIPLMVLSTIGDVSEMGGNINSFAGTTGELRLAPSPPRLPNSDYIDYVLDDISLSDTPIPEPGQVELAMVIITASQRRKRGRS